MVEWNLFGFIKEEMKIIVINSPKYGKHEVFVDDEDFDLVDKYTWHLQVVKKSNLKYAGTNVYNSETKKCTQIKMHRLIMKFPEFIIDHFDRNGLNNQKANFRLCSHTENVRNSVVIQINNTTGFRGVFFEPKKKLYRAMIGVDGKIVGGGRFKSPLKAAMRYNELALKYHGEFATLNIIK